MAAENYIRQDCAGSCSHLRGEPRASSAALQQSVGTPSIKVLNCGAWCRSVHDAAEEGFSGLPVFAVGESLGGCISVHLCKSLVRLTAPKASKQDTPSAFLQNV